MLFIYLQVFSSIICLGVNAIFQILLCRYFPGYGLLKSLVLGFVVGFISLLLLNYFMFTENLSNFASGIPPSIISYTAFGYCYFHFVNLGETARRIRILRELYESENGLTMQEILERYNAKQIIDARLSRLLNTGQIVTKGGRYFAGKPLMLIASKAIILLKLLVLGKKSEFG